MAISGANWATAQAMISCGVLRSNSPESPRISSEENMEENYTRYNDGVNPETTKRLLSLNRQFYNDHGSDFSETRRRLQPGVTRLLGTLHGDESILDAGCGNGELARALSRGGHHGSYLGLDFSLPLLKEARREAFVFPVQFVEADLVELTTKERGKMKEVSGTTSSFFFPLSSFDIVFCFAVLHHIPSCDLRLAVVRKVCDLLKPEGLFLHSNWQFLNSARLKARIQPWEAIGLAQEEVEANDYLLDWKRGGMGLRYVHHFNEEELSELAHAAHFEIEHTFYSDGQNRKLGLYQIWKKTP